MSADGHLLLQLVLIAVLILINAFFAASELAVVTANDARLKKLAEDGNRQAAELLRMLALPSSFLATIQVGVTLSGLMASAVASETFADRIVVLFNHTSVSPALVKAISVVVITILLSFFTLVFGELVPKRLAMKNPEKIALRVSGTLHRVALVFKPFVMLLAFTTNVIASLFGVSPKAEQKNVTEEEIRMMVDVGEESGTIEENEKEMINNVFEFNDRTAGDVMTHRNDICAVEITATLDEIVKAGEREGYSRIPVYEDDLDNIVGIVMIKDLLQFIGINPKNTFDLKKIMRAPLFIPETKRCDELFTEFCSQKQHMAVVVDEYGVTAGIVTMEDIVESIVGDIQDEYDNEEAEFSKINDNTYTLDGMASIEEVSELLGVELPEGDYDTVGGLVLDRLGRIPEENEHPSVTVENVTFTVQRVEERRIDRLLAVKKDPPASTQEESA